MFGRNNAKWFDRYGFDYFTREVYDAFYPGYGASWPAYYGAVAMTYEQASTRGLALLRSDGDVLQFRDAVRHHFVASVSTAETAAAHREVLLRDFWRYRKSAIEEGKNGDVREIVLPYRGNLGNVDKLAGLLVQQGVEVKRATAEIESCGERYPAGSYVVSLVQPAKRLVHNLLDPQVPMDEGFLAEQERRRAKLLGDQIYDVTAWSLPMQFGIAAVPCRSAANGLLENAGPELVRPARPIGGPAQVGYLVPWTGNASAALLTRALAQGLVALSPDVAFTQGGRRYPAGTLVFKLDDNPADLSSRLEALAQETGAEVRATDTGWVEQGVNFGSAQVARLRGPRVALGWDTPTASYAAGATRYVLERRYGYPVTAIRIDTLAGADLSRYQVLVLPPGSSYLEALGESGANRLRAWVEAGGTLVGVEGAIDFLADEDVELLATARQKLPAPDERELGLLETEEEYLQAIRPESASPDAVAGVLLRARDRDGEIRPEPSRCVPPLAAVRAEDRRDLPRRSGRWASAGLTAGEAAFRAGTVSRHRFVDIMCIIGTKPEVARSPGLPPFTPSAGRPAPIASWLPNGEDDEPNVRPPAFSPAPASRGSFGVARVIKRPRDADTPARTPGSSARRVATRIT